VDLNESLQKEPAVFEMIRSLRRRMTSSTRSPNGSNRCVAAGCGRTLELWERSGGNRGGRVKMLKDVGAAEQLSIIAENQAQP